MQRVDDVTGEPIQLSATQRERWRRATEQRVSELIQANNHLYAAHNALMARVEHLEERNNEFVMEIKPALYRELGLLDDKIVTMQYVPLWRRMWNAVMGR